MVLQVLENQSQKLQSRLTDPVDSKRGCWGRLLREETLGLGFEGQIGDLQERAHEKGLRAQSGNGNSDVFQAI
jgi:hypothetical protein